ncbi:hypothetical protein [Arthrobacter sp. SDTb3-6]|uniref:hypothetical protein n=1 Tax=Arthrobacter sp. SDTb3-6 TaxID=2713571 RepID=UPI00159E6594|nr:hypothetical protein [Arthrobacter sp. SDTb3-6]NVN00021.1 hypothetical protein [Arthrobacter sp. SDTb3-6]
MSKDQEPVRSRRQLREANVAQTQGAPGKAPVPIVAAPSTADVERRGRRTQPGAPVDAGAKGTPAAGGPAPSAAQATPANRGAAPAPRERQSQTRARDRAALRAYKELVDAAPAQQNPLPSRRALRQAQLDAERAPVTSITPVVQPAKAPAQAKAVPPTAPAAGPAGPARPAATAAPKPGGKPAPGTVGKPAGAPAAKAAPGAGTAAPDAAAPGNEAPHRARMGRRASAAAPDSPAPAAGTRGAAPTAGRPPAQRPDTGALPARQNPATGSVPAQRPARPVPGMPYPSVSVGPRTPSGQAPSTEELRLLAEQRAQSDRAAILDQRAQARERLAQESAKSRREPADPTATNNLAMVTPIEFVEVPGADRPVMRPPSTTHVPIVTRSTPRLAPSRRPQAGKQAAGKAAAGKPAAGTTNQAPDPNAERFDAALAARSVHRPGPGSRPLTGGRSGTLQRAEAMAGVVRPGAAVQAAAVTRTQMPPMPADYAHGLEPLDAVTAGLGRTQRNLLIQWGSIILGGAALVVGAVMFITALAH